VRESPYARAKASGTPPLLPFTSFYFHNVGDGKRRHRAPGPLSRGTRRRPSPSLPLDEKRSARAHGPACGRFDSEGTQKGRAPKSRSGFTQTCGISPSRQLEASCGDETGGEFLRAQAQVRPMYAFHFPLTRAQEPLGALTHRFTEGRHPSRHQRDRPRLETHFPQGACERQVLFETARSQYQVGLDVPKLDCKAVEVDCGYGIGFLQDDLESLLGRPSERAVEKSDPHARKADFAHPFEDAAEIGARRRGQPHEESEAPLVEGVAPTLHGFKAES
jgi:hypothetical protein